MDPAGKVAVVTGGNSGLGEATAQVAARAQVVKFARVALFILENPLLNGDVIRLDAGTRPPARTSWAGPKD